MSDESRDDQEYVEIKASNLKDKRNGFVGWTGHFQLPNIFKVSLTKRNWCPHIMTTPKQMYWN